MRTLLPFHLIHTILAFAAAQELEAHEAYEAALSRVAAVTAAALATPTSTPPTYLPALDRHDVCYDDSWRALNVPWMCALDEEAELASEPGAAEPEPEPELASNITDEPLNASDALNTSDVPFESFEDWKRRREPSAPEPLPSENASESSPPPPPPLNASDNSTTLASPPPPPSSAPRPKGHRYNYASPDCSARVLASSPLTQHASSLLHKSRDRYMLTPCRAEEHWAVVELCDEIRVEAVELAVWEFFSGIVRSVRVSVADDAEGEWEVVAEFVGKNVRGAQTFTLPEPTSFHRFLRLDFPSFYGSEYYCPVSQLKVWGMNQMEAFKMEQRRAAEASGAAEKKARESEREAERAAETARIAERETREREDDERRQRELCELERLVQEQARRVSGVENVFEPLIECTPSSSSSSSSSASSASSASALSPSSAPGEEASELASAQDPPYVGAGTPPTPPEPGTTAYRGRADTSESIYAFITRRLNALEGNTTLVARYIDEQAKALRAALERAEQRWADERGRDEARYDVDRMRQEDRLGRLLVQIEHMRSASDAERRMTETRLQLLADELGFERRRSLAQLVVLVSIIVLGALSRGEAIDALLRPLSGDAVRRRREATRDERKAKRLSTGPLAGLLIDVGPPAPTDGPASPSTPRGKRRPLGPAGSVRRRTPGTRSISLAEPGALFDNADDSPRALQAHRGRISTVTPRPRRLARSSHLHAMRRRDGSASEADPGPEERGTPTPRPRLDRLESHGASGGDEGSTSEVEEVLSSDEDDVREPRITRVRIASVSSNGPGWVLDGRGEGSVRFRRDVDQGEALARSL